MRSGLQGSELFADFAHGGDAVHECVFVAEAIASQYS